MANRQMEAMQLWNWIQWRLPNTALWFEAQRVLAGNQPTPTDPQLAAGLAELLNPATTNARRLQLLEQLLLIVRDG